MCLQSLCPSSSSWEWLLVHSCSSAWSMLGLGPVLIIPDPGIGGMGGCSKPYYFLFLPTSFNTHLISSSGLTQGAVPGWGGMTKKHSDLTIFSPFLGFFHLMLHLDLSGELLSVCQQCSGYVKIFVSILDKVLPHLCDQPDVTIFKYILRSFLVKNTKPPAII